MPEGQPIIERCEDKTGPYFTFTLHIGPVSYWRMGRFISPDEAMTAARRHIPVPEITRTYKLNRH